MNIQIASDLHLDQLKSLSFKDIIFPNSDILILAGDVCHIETFHLYDDFFNYLNENFKYIIYIPGNHEFYNKRGKSIEDLENILKYLLSKYKNFIYLNNNSILLEDVLITGSCLWCSPKIDPPPWFKIDIKKEKINKLKEDSISYLQKVSSLNVDKHVIITHYPPVNIAKTHRKNDLYNDYYNNDNICLPFYPKYWIFGHTHKNLFKTIENTTYISNQRKDKSYNNSLVITI